jgi:hypothetical protein
MDLLFGLALFVLLGLLFAAAAVAAIVMIPSAIVFIVASLFRRVEEEVESRDSPLPQAGGPKPGHPLPRGRPAILIERATRPVFRFLRRLVRPAIVVGLPVGLAVAFAGWLQSDGVGAVEAWAYAGMFWLLVLGWRWYQQPERRSARQARIAEMNAVWHRWENDRRSQGARMPSAGKPARPSPRSTSHPRDRESDGRRTHEGPTGVSNNLPPGPGLEPANGLAAPRRDRQHERGAVAFNSLWILRLQESREKWPDFLDKTATCGHDAISFRLCDHHVRRLLPDLLVLSSEKAARDVHGTGNRTAFFQGEVFVPSAHDLRTMADKLMQLREVNSAVGAADAMVVVRTIASLTNPVPFVSPAVLIVASALLERGVDHATQLGLVALSQLGGDQSLALVQRHADAFARIRESA